MKSLLTEVSVSFFVFRADGYPVVMETLGMEYGTKKIQRRATEIVNHMVLYLSFKIDIGLS